MKIYAIYKKKLNVKQSAKIFKKDTNSFLTEIKCFIAEYLF